MALSAGSGGRDGACPTRVLRVVPGHGLKAFPWIGYVASVVCAWHSMIGPGCLWFRQPSHYIPACGVPAADLPPAAAKHGSEGLSRGHGGDPLWGLLYRPLSFVPAADSLCPLFIGAQSLTVAWGGGPAPSPSAPVSGDLGRDICAYPVGRPMAADRSLPASLPVRPGRARWRDWRAACWPPGPLPIGSGGPQI